MARGWELQLIVPAETSKMAGIEGGGKEEKVVISRSRRRKGTLGRPKQQMLTTMSRVRESEAPVRGT